jgi:hypothetical protein
MKQVGIAALTLAAVFRHHPATEPATLNAAGFR